MLLEGQDGTEMFTVLTALKRGPRMAPRVAGSRGALICVKGLPPGAVGRGLPRKDCR